MCNITVRKATPADRTELVRMRSSLWPTGSQKQHAQEIEPFFADKPTSWAKSFTAVAVFVAVRSAGGLCGFIEISIRSHAEGCETNPVGYIEGWFVDAEMRRQGIGRMLIKAAEEWALEQGCKEMASDAEIGNTKSLTAHEKLGFEVTSRAVHLRKRLTS